MTRKEQAEHTKAHLIAVAQELFIEQGYQATSIAQILDQAGLAKGALYHHFPDGKRSLFAEVVDVVDEQLHHGFEEVLTTINSPTEQIIAGVDLVLELATDRAFGRIILIEAAVVMPGAWAEGSEFQLLRASLQQAIEQHEINPTPLDATAALLYGAARRSADYVARANNPQAAADDARQVFRSMINALRTDERAND